MSQLLNLVMFIQILHLLSLLKINAVDSERTFSFFAEFGTQEKVAVGET